MSARDSCGVHISRLQAGKSTKASSVRTQREFRFKTCQWFQRHGALSSILNVEINIFRWSGQDPPKISPRRHCAGGGAGNRLKLIDFTNSQCCYAQLPQLLPLLLLSLVTGAAVAVVSAAVGTLFCCLTTVTSGTVVTSPGCSLLVLLKLPPRGAAAAAAAAACACTVTTIDAKILNLVLRWQCSAHPCTNPSGLLKYVSRM